MARLAEIFAVSNKDFREKPVASLKELKLGVADVKEVIHIDSDELEDFEVRGLIEFQEVNLADPGERNAYLSRARTRLQELRRGREKLAKLIQQYYEPHYLL